jgi:type II secretory pathway pseudopilin PulG
MHAQQPRGLHAQWLRSDAAHWESVAVEEDAYAEALERFAAEASERPVECVAWLQRAPLARSPLGNPGRIDPCDPDDPAVVTGTASAPFDAPPPSPERVDTAQITADLAASARVFTASARAAFRSRALPGSHLPKGVVRRKGHQQQQQQQQQQHQQQQQQQQQQKQQQQQQQICGDGEGGTLPAGDDARTAEHNNQTDDASGSGNEMAIDASLVGETRPRLRRPRQSTAGTAASSFGSSAGAGGGADGHDDDDSDAVAGLGGRVSGRVLSLDTASGQMVAPVHRDPKESRRGSVAEYERVTWIPAAIDPPPMTHSTCMGKGVVVNVRPAVSATSYPAFSSSSTSSSLSTSSSSTLSSSMAAASDLGRLVRFDISGRTKGGLPTTAERGNDGRGGDSGGADDDDDDPGGSACSEDAELVAEIRRLRRLRDNLVREVPVAREGGGASARHDGYRCDACGADPIVGTRWSCTVCDEVDLCETCHGQGDYDAQGHAATHPCNQYDVAMAGDEFAYLIRG